MPTERRHNGLPIKKTMGMYRLYEYVPKRFLAFLWSYVVYDLRISRVIKAEQGKWQKLTGEVTRADSASTFVGIKTRYVQVQ